MPLPSPTINFPKMQASMSRIIGQSQPDTCEIDRNTPTSDNAGGQVASWSAIATGVAVRVEPVSILRSGTEMEAAAKLTSIQARVFCLPSGQDVTVKDQIVYQGLTYVVKAVEGPLSFELYRRVLVDLVS